MNRSDKSRFNLKTSFWNEDQITVKNAFEEFEGFDMRSDVGTMQATDLLALYLAVESKLIIKAMTTEYLMLGDHFCGHINLISSRLKITRLGHKLWLITYFEDLFMKYRSERKGKLSKYWSYISILPDSYPTVLSGWFSNWLFYLLSNPLSQIGYLEHFGDVVERHLWTKNPHVNGYVVGRHLWTNNPQQIAAFDFLDFMKNSYLGAS